jgi:hypothetical protein
MCVGQITPDAPQRTNDVDDVIQLMTPVTFNLNESTSCPGAPQRTATIDANAGCITPIRMRHMDVYPIDDVVPDAPHHNAVMDNENGYLTPVKLCFDSPVAPGAPRAQRAHRD